MDFEINPLLRLENIGRLLRRFKVNPLRNVIGTFMARDALSLASEYLGLSAEDTVLLPAYLCPEVFKPFNSRAKIQFYEIRSDLTVDPDEIRFRTDREGIKLAVLINYFGFLQPYRKEIKEICADRGVLLLEDCAHSLLTEGSGDTGDFSVYSFRKILPVPDGGGLRINIKGERLITPKFYPRFYSDILSLLIIAKISLNVRSHMLSRARDLFAY